MKARNEKLEKELLLMKQSNDQLMKQKLEKARYSGCRPTLFQERLLQIEIERQELAKTERERRREKAMQQKRVESLSRLTP